LRFEVARRRHVPRDHRVHLPRVGRRKRGVKTTWAF
jgi:hypothetical protein